MPIMRGCCCYESLVTGSRASAVFSAVTAIANIIIDIWMLVNMHWLDRELEPHEKEIWLPPGCIPFIYIELVVNLALVALSMMLWIGINYSYEGRKFVHFWLYGITGSRIYHVFLGIYALVWIGGHRISDIVYIAPETIVVAMYWMLNCFVMIAAVLCVVSYWQDLMDEIHGKEKKIRYYHKLANIRSAARPDGGATPTSSYFGLSRSALNVSQPSMAHSQRGYPQPPPQQQQQQQQQYAKPQMFQGRQHGPPSHQGYPQGPPPQGPPPQQRGYPPPQQGPPRQQQGYAPPQQQGYAPPQQQAYQYPQGQGQPPQGGYYPAPRPQGLPPHMQREVGAPQMQRRY